MVNMIPDVTAAADKRGGFVMGVFPLSDARTCTPGSTGAAARPRAYWASHVVGGHGFGLLLGQQNPSNQYDASTTPIAAGHGAWAGGARAPPPGWQRKPPPPTPPHPPPVPPRLGGGLWVRIRRGNR